MFICIGLLGGYFSLFTVHFDTCNAEAYDNCRTEDEEPDVSVTENRSAVPSVHGNRYNLALCTAVDGETEDVFGSVLKSSFLGVEIPGAAAVDGVEDRCACLTGNGKLIGCGRIENIQNILVLNIIDAISILHVKKLKQCYLMAI